MYVRINDIIVLFALFLGTQAQLYANNRETAPERTQKQLFVHLASDASTNEFKTKLPKGFSVESFVGSYAVIHSERNLPAADLQRIKTITDVHKVVSDGLIEFFANSDENRNCSIGSKNETADLINGTALEKLTEVISATNSDCDLNTSCHDNGQTRLWAQQWVDGDLMLGELKRLGIENSSTKVAVIDTGFDVAGNATEIANVRLQFEKGFTSAGDPRHDPASHGTSVIGLIGGQNGVGLAPNMAITLYRATAGEDLTFGSSAEVKLAIEKACVDGNEIINMSGGAIPVIGGMWGDWAESTDVDSDEQFAKQLAEKGCLVIKAAGNTPQLRDFPSADPDDGFLRVIAIDQTGKQASFSSAGEIGSPGKDIFTLESTNGKPNKSFKHCGGYRGVLKWGTSSAAPIITAITAQVVSVLKLNPLYVTLKGPEKIKLVNRILFASRLSGSANGLRAVLIAEQWNKNGLVQIPSSAALAKSLIDPKSQLCPDKSNYCQGETMSSCEALRCLNATRRSVTICGSANQADLQKALGIAYKSGNIEVATRILGSAQNIRSVADSGLSAWRDHLIKYSGNKTFDFEPVLRHYALVLRLGAKNNADVENILYPQIYNELLSGNYESRTRLWSILSKEGLTDIKFLTFFLRRANYGEEAVLAALQAIRNSSKADERTEEFLRQLAVSKTSTDEVLADIAFTSADDNLKLKSRFTLLRSVLSSPEAGSSTLSAVLETIHKSDATSEDIEKVLREIVNSPKADNKVLRSAAESIEVQREPPISNRSELLFSILSKYTAMSGAADYSMITVPMILAETAIRANPPISGRATLVRKVLESHSTQEIFDDVVNEICSRVESSSDLWELLSEMIYSNHASARYQAKAIGCLFKVNPEKGSTLVQNIVSSDNTDPDTLEELVIIVLKNPISSPDYKLMLKDLVRSSKLKPNNYRNLVRLLKDSGRPLDGLNQILDDLVVLAKSEDDLAEIGEALIHTNVPIPNRTVLMRRIITSSSSDKGLARLAKQLHKSNLPKREVNELLMAILESEKISSKTTSEIRGYLLQR